MQSIIYFPPVDLTAVWDDDKLVELDPSNISYVDNCIIKVDTPKYKLYRRFAIGYFYLNFTKVIVVPYASINS